MASRLALKYGLVSEEDRLSNSSDAIIVTEPTTGSKARTKGSLYLIVSSKSIGGRTRDACRLVADTIRREYYYDESAGIAIVLEKAVRAANRTPAPVARGRRPRRVLDRHRPRRRAQQRAVRRDRR